MSVIVRPKRAPRLPLRWAVSIFVCALWVGSCKPDDQKTGSVSREDVRQARSRMPAAVAAHVDSGNAAYRRQDYPAALAQYRAAIRIDNHQAAPWFGIYMTQRAMGNAAAADSALQRAQKVAPGATLLHSNGDTARTDQ